MKKYEAISERATDVSVEGWGILMLLPAAPLMHI